MAEGKKIKKLFFSLYKDTPPWITIHYARFHFKICCARAEVFFFFFLQNIVFIFFHFYFFNVFCGWVILHRSPRRSVAAPQPPKQSLFRSLHQLPSHWLGLQKKKTKIKAWVFLCSFWEKLLVTFIYPGQDSGKKDSSPPWKYEKKNPQKKNSCSFSLHRFS